MKVYVTTKARPFQDEQFIDVYPTHKAAENALRSMFPHMRKSVGDYDTYTSDKSGSWILFIHEKEV